MAQTFENSDKSNQSPEGEKQENVESQAEAEIHLKEQELYQLVGPPEAGKTRIEIVDADTDEPRFMMSKVMEPQEDEKEFLPEGSAMTVTMHGTRKQEKESSYWEVTGAKFEMGGKSLRLTEILPEDCKLVLNKEETNTYLHLKKTVSLNRLSEIDDVVTLLHEAGHAHDHKRKGITLDMSQSEVTGNIEEAIEHEIAESQSMERDAWTQAHKIARRADWPIQNKIRIESAKSMATYDQHVATTTWRGSDQNQFATSEQRRAMRSPEKQLEAKHQKELGIHAKKIAEGMTNKLGTNLNEVLKNDPNRGGQSTHISFNLPSEDKDYSIDIHKPGQLFEEDDTVYLTVTEATTDDNGDVNVLSVQINGARSTRVTEGKLRSGGETESQLETKWVGNMGVLLADENTKEPTETYQKAKELLSSLDKETVGERMAIETFRQMYPDVSEPPDHDLQTGKKLELEEKIAWMKNDSGIYKILETQRRELEAILLKAQKAAEEDSLSS